ncbi:serine hydrolase domain-containing protein [Nonomuraea sp. NPDC005983]|uniref:serine hydrolase domain-containing protein n=1 Tax=Nonomuraea sp. NPDC005983 TaxID=3155595 RepID=UPI0033B88ABC
MFRRLGGQARSPHRPLIRRRGLSSIWMSRSSSVRTVPPRDTAGSVLTMYKRAMCAGLAGMLAISLLSSPAAATGAHSGLRQALQRLTEDNDVPGALAQIHNAHGDTVITSGVADVETKRPVPTDSRFRIGSKTKTFVATVTLQLVGDGRIELDAPVERYLPGLVGPDITVRQLLQHTSGLPDYLPLLDPADILAHRYDHWNAADLVTLALQRPAEFPPGTDWSYSNTNYLIVGMIIEKVTGNTFGTEIRNRILRPLRLNATSVPDDALDIPGPHPSGYLKTGDGLLDITRHNPSVAGASGGMISSASDLNRFYDALLHGRLLRPAELKEMMTTRPLDGPGGAAYGLGLMSTPLPCGGLLWGHAGDTLGFRTSGGATLDGRQVTVMTNLYRIDGVRNADLDAVVTTALCENR